MHMNDFPAWYYGPEGQQQVFQRAEDVPEGWQDHPSKVITAAKTGSKPQEPKVDKIPAAQRGAAPVTAGSNATAQQTGGKAVETGDQSNTLDAHGWAWDPQLHAATQSKTSAGLWRMRVGVSRPAPKEGFPKPTQPLDL
jgi:hypothetical protein